MLFHITMTHTVEDCPGYNQEKLPEVMAAVQNVRERAEKLNVKCHFWVEGAPEHVAYALIETDNPAAVPAFITGAVPFRQNFKVTLVHDWESLEEVGKLMALPR